MGNFDQRAPKGRRNRRRLANHIYLPLHRQTLAPRLHENNRRQPRRIRPIAGCAPDERTGRRMTLHFKPCQPQQPSPKRTCSRPNRTHIHVLTHPNRHLFFKWPLVTTPRRHYTLLIQLLADTRWNAGDTLGMRRKQLPENQVKGA